MLTFEEAQEILSEAADEIPPEIFRELNGGIILVPEVLRKGGDTAGNLYILGQYHNEPRGMGRYVQVYYGSFCAVYGSMPRETQAARLREILFHELTHHLESLAGDRTLEKEDARKLARYKRDLRR